MPEQPKGPSPSDERTREAVSGADPSHGYGLMVCTEGRIFAVQVPAVGLLTIGRGETCDLPIPDGSMSRKHAVVHGGDPPMLEDLGSMNGTRVGGRALSRGDRAPLPIGTVLELGSVTLLVQKWSPSLSQPRPLATSSPGLVLEDAAMKHLYGLIDIVAPSNISVLILGETGVGKEVFAETIHKRSARAAKAFLKLNCAALPESILESELFGHERGAFTGAVQTKLGLFESADGGSVLLDEVGELPLATQAKLLRVLESGEVLRVGSVKSKRIDVRFMSATNRDLQSRIETGQFRADLFFRLNGFAVTIPALRERKDDIPALARFFLADACRRMNKRPLEIGAETVAMLKEHPWPGNIRELRNIIDRAALLCTGRSVEPSDIGLVARISGERPRAVESAATQPPPTPFVSVSDETRDRAPVTIPNLPAIGPRNLRAEVESLERERILAALEQCGGNQSRAAKMLGIARRTLLMRLDSYGIARPRKGQSDD